MRDLPIIHEPRPSSFQLFRLLAAAALVVALCSSAAASPGQLGVEASVGVPDGATATLTFRPISMVKVSGGLGYNLIAPGIRAGVSVAPPMSFFVTPTLNVEAGHFFVGDANGAAQMFGSGGEEGSDEPVLREVGYQFANFHLGLEFGGSRVAFFVHAGMSAIRGEIRNLDEQVNSGDNMDGPTVEIRDDPVVKLWVPSARTGVTVFF